MTPLKDTIDAPHQNSESATAQGSEQSRPSQGLRSDAVSLDVPVKVHGSRVTDVVLGVTSHTEPFEEETATMIVFPQGGVLKMSTPVTVGQMVVLTNLKSGHDAICRVVKVRAYAQSQSYVEIEFTNRQPGYWGVLFTADAAAPAPQKVTRPAASATTSAGSNVSSAAAPVVPIASQVEVEKAVESERHSTPPAPPVAAFVPPPVIAAKPVQPIVPPASAAAGAGSERAAQPNKPASPFVGIGSQENVQPSASETASKQAIRPAAMPAPSLSMAELRGDGPSASSHSSPISSFGSGVPGEVLELPLDEVEQEQAATEQHAAAPPLVTASANPDSGDAAARPVFGSRFDSGVISGSAQESAPPEASNNKLLIGLGIAAALVLAAAGPYYFHAWPFASASPASVSATGTPAAPDAVSTAGRPVLSNSATSATASAPAAMKPSTSLSPSQAANAPKTGKPAIAEQPAEVQPASPVNDKPAKAVPNMFGVLNAHPSSNAASSRESVNAPSIDPGVGSGSDVAALVGSAAPGLAAPLASGGSVNANLPIPLGGDVKPPRLLHSVAPVYPSVARATGVEGKIVVETSIDQTGSVTGTKVVSGPLLLRQAALDALTHWKYQPATLNGNPIPVQFTVVIDFHR